MGHQCLQLEILDSVDSGKHMNPEHQTPFENLPEIGRGVAAHFAQQPTRIDVGFLGEPYMVFAEMIQLFANRDCGAMLKHRPGVFGAGET